MKLRNEPRRVAEAQRPPSAERLAGVARRAQEGLGLDLAAGTGRLTHELARRLARVVAAESDEGIRAFVAEGDMLAGSAEDSPPLRATAFTAAARRSSQVGHDGVTLPSLWSDRRTVPIRDGVDGSGTHCSVSRHTLVAPMSPWSDQR